MSSSVGGVGSPFTGVIGIVHWQNLGCSVFFEIASWQLCPSSEVIGHLGGRPKKYLHIVGQVLNRWFVHVQKWEPEAKLYNLQKWVRKHTHVVGGLGHLDIRWEMQAVQGI